MDLSVTIRESVKQQKSQGVTQSRFSLGKYAEPEAAIEMGFLKDRILLTASYYNNRSSDQLGFTLPAF